MNADGPWSDRSAIASGRAPRSCGAERGCSLAAVARVDVGVADVTVVVLVRAGAVVGVEDIA